MKLERWKKFTRLALVLALCGGVGVACDDDDDDGPTGPTTADLAGTWVASQAQAGTQFQLTLNANPQVQVDLVGQAAFTITLVVQETGDFNLDLDDPTDLQDQMVNGSFDVTGDNTITVTTAEASFNGTFSLSNDGDTVSLTVENTTLADLTGDGEITEADAALLEATFNRTA